ncbi:hypothetical protein DS834_02945 [Lactobacillus bombicola]|uniref:DUF1828 domain-containing protein n=1 Tax=Lactobacillus bombicola TaxID=1505723 RepID=A0ABX9LVG0_9LACO|nr:DUF1828 domain-containing protein [Lactobacillus bombicola]RHW52858.1 hypothetical protein DS834_02945 [Lactobacillus bombicola]
MLDAKKLNQEYLDWVKKSYEYNQLDNGIVEIVSPFLDNFSDEIGMYAIPKKNGKIKLTDDGWTIDNLNSIGVNINKSKSRKNILEQQAKSYGIDVIDGELCTEVSEHDFPVAKHRLLQAIIFVNDMFMMAPKTTSNVFFDDIDNFFTENNIRTTKNSSYIGQSGLTHRYEFSIPGFKDDVPLRLIKTMAAGNNTMFAKSIVTDVMQTEPVVKNENPRFYVMLNNYNKNNKIIEINQDILNLFKSSSIQPVLYSEREKFLPEFRE